MDDLRYIRFKDALPVDTVYKIKNILYGMGILTIDNWLDTGIEGCYALRVTIAGTSMGTNGKGTDPAYAMASAYAELMERMQNHMLYLGGLSDEAIAHADFLVTPDERYCSYEEIAAMDNVLLKHVISMTMGQSPEINSRHRLACIKSWTLFNPPGHSHSAITVPFYSYVKRKPQYLVYDMYSSIYGSNGMCAGNTPEEALVQGLSEIFERYVNKKLITERITPPTIPDRYLMNDPGLYKIIQGIQQSGRYKVVVKDCSLGKKYPVVGTIIIDTSKGTFGLKLGVHPSFRIALERTMTEAFQGQSIESFSQSCSLGYGDDFLDHRDNAVNIAKVGAGQYPAALLLDKFSYEFTPFMAEPVQPNKAMLQGMVQLLVNQGYDLLVRDVSFLGFPSYQIIVPGFSEMYPVDLLRTKELKTYTALSKTVCNLNQASNEELERIVRYIRFKRYSLLENQVHMILGRPLVKALPGGSSAVDFLMAVCLCKLGRWDEACRVFRSMALIHDAAEGDQYCYYNCLADYAKAKSAGLDRAETQAILQQLYPTEIAQRVCRQLNQPEQVFDRIYPKFSCWDCDNCQALKYCCYQETEKIYKAIKERYAANPLKQERLAEILHGGGVL
ncbi:YcaO-like family protein [Desulfotomaculum sp. 1211_IL3151]|uniref:YcaO-like family protein n=1 Tax=Desulfotomaculum sp. 1211_IL3151 TaxID=3084055 RepID=UPI002FDA319C